MVSEADDLEEALRQNLTLRRQLGAAVASAKPSKAKESGGSLPGSAIEGAQPASDDLDKLRLDLTHRRVMDIAAEYEIGAPLAPDGTEESLTARMIWKAWVMVGVAGLALAVLMTLWLVYSGH